MNLQRHPIAAAAALALLGALAPTPVGVTHWDDMPAVTDDYAIARDAIRDRVSAFFIELGCER